MKYLRVLAFATGFEISWRKIVDPWFKPDLKDKNAKAFGVHDSPESPSGSGAASSSGVESKMHSERIKPFDLSEPHIPPMKYSADDAYWQAAAQRR